MDWVHLANNIHISSKSYKFDDKRGRYMARLHLVDYIIFSSKPYKSAYKWVKYMGKLRLTNYVIIPELQGLFQLGSIRDRINITHYYYSRSWLEMYIQHISLNRAKPRQHCSQFRSIGR